MIQYLTRASYGAGPVTVGHAVPISQFVGLVVHHTVIVLPDYDHDSLIAGDLDDCIRYMQQLQHARPDLGDDCPYSYVVFEGAEAWDCVVAEGRGLGRTGAHTIGYNSSRYGCAFAGDFTTWSPTPGMWEGVRFVGRMLDQPADANPTLEHRDVYATQCPGISTPSPAPAQPPFTASPTPIPPLPPPPSHLQQKADDTVIFAYKGSQYCLHDGKLAVSSSDLAPGVKLPNLDQATFERFVKLWGPVVT